MCRLFCYECQDQLRACIQRDSREMVHICLDLCKADSSPTVLLLGMYELEI